MTKSRPRKNINDRVLLVPWDRMLSVLMQEVETYVKRVYDMNWLP